MRSICWKNIVIGVLLFELASYFVASIFVSYGIVFNGFGLT